MRLPLLIAAIFNLNLNFVAEAEATEASMIRKSRMGETAILPCPSNDDHHRFQYWILKNDQVVGPWNNREENKFRYEVWSGRLIIRAVTDEESGFYKCFSKNITGNDMKVEAVELLVLRDWIDAFENDPKVNAYRATIAILVLFSMIGIGIFAFLIRRRRSYVPEESREQSPDPLLGSVNNGVYRATNISVKKMSAAKALDHENVETDISTSFSLPN